VLKSDKALLCEKPFARNLSEAKAIVECAREQELFCMEAMWMRFNPLIQYAKQALQNNRIGLTRTVNAELGYRKDADTLGTVKEGRGALLAFGCYGVSLALFLFGPPIASQACWLPNNQGGDETAALTLHHDDVLVSFRCSEGATLSNNMEIQGTEGSIHIDSPFIDATTLDLINITALQSRSVWTRIRDKLKSMTGSFPSEDTRGHIQRFADSLSGFRNEAQEATDCIQAGKLESSVMPLEDTLTVHRILDAALETPVSSTDWNHEL
jgi:predicted dehydrogenase